MTRHYNELNGVIVFSQSTLTNDEGRLAPVSTLVSSGESTPACGPDVQDASTSSMDPGQLLAASEGWSLLSPAGRSCSSCAPNPGAGTAVLCNITLLDERTFSNVGRATPGSMAPWLREHAPEPEDTLAPACYLGYART